MAGYFSEGHALVVGVGSYAHQPTWDVPVTARDAREVDGVLQDPASCGYHPDRIRYLSDEAATKDGILAGLGDLARGVGKDDTALVFYAGHGQFDTEGRYCLTAHDSRVQDRKVVAGTGIDEDELYSALRKIKAGKMLFLFNACFAGRISPRLGAGEDQADLPTAGTLSEPAAYKILGSGSGRVIITASRGRQYSYFDLVEDGLTWFGQALVDGLRGEAGQAGESGFISAYGLYEYIYHTVLREVKNRYNDTQEPELTVIQGVGPFPVALFRGASTLGRFDAGERPPDRAAVRPVKQEDVARYVQIAGRDAIHVDTGGGDAFLGGFSGIMVKGDQYNIEKFEDRSVNISGGSVTDTTIITGNRNRVGDQTTQISLGDFKELVQQLRMSLERAGLPADERTEALDDLRRVEQEIEKPAPNKNIVLKRLESLVGFLSDSATIVTALPQLLEMGRQLLDAGRKLFR